MTRTPHHSSLAETDIHVIRAELDRLLSDRRFSGARQMSNFLRYIVTETISGNGARIKAYTVGVDALGKPDDFDAQADPSVRVLALRLRKTLAAAYEEGQPCHARIVLRVGSYVPEFYKPEAFADVQPRATLPSPDHATVDGESSPEEQAPKAAGAVNRSPAGNKRISGHGDVVLHGAARSGSLDGASHAWSFDARIRPDSLARVRDTDQQHHWFPLIAISLLLLFWQAVGQSVQAATDASDTSRSSMSVSSQILPVDGGVAIDEQQQPA